MEYYKRMEPTAAPRDEKLSLVGGLNPRMRFSVSNGLGDVSDTLWQVILSNPEKGALKNIHAVAQGNAKARSSSA